MQTVEFLERVWPGQGVYFLLRATHGWKRHYAFDSAREAAEAALAWDRQGQTVYHALASYKARFIERPDAAQPSGTKRVYRVQENVSHLRALWLDLDVDPAPPDRNRAAKTYRSQQAAVTALTAFVRAARLPAPTMLVSSGAGIHVYWTFTQGLGLEEWEPVAQMLKRLCAAHGFLAGPERTADPCSVLRPVGTTHRKAEPLSVTLLGATPDLEFPIFAQALVRAAAAKGVTASVTPVRTSSHSLNDDLIVKREFPPASAHQIARACAQIGSIAATRGNVEEPLWYGGIGVLRFCTESPNISHEWSNGHPGYSESETSAKIAQHERSGTGPTTCDRFRDLNPTGCAGCPHAGKVKSPIQLGVVIEQAPAPIDPFGGGAEAGSTKSPGVTLPNPPHPYIRTKDGKLGKVEADGQIEVFCDYDLYPTQRLWDIKANVQTVMLHMATGADTRKEAAALPVGILMEGGKDFKAWLGNHGVYIQGKAVNQVQAYLLHYMRELQQASQSLHLHNQLGWKDDHTAFVLGHSIHYANGPSTDNAGAVATINGFQKRGDLDIWKRVMELYGRPGMEPYQFAIGAAFGAPLMPFTGYEGAVIAMISPEGGQGKTTALHAINSVWGNPQDIGLQANDTPMAVLKRIGAYNNMPVTLDELSNATGQQLSDLAYQITQGRERRRLKADATEQATLARWSTILTVTANQSLLGRLSTYKTNSDAEVHRIIEYAVRNPMVVNKAEAEAHFPLLFEHYGLAGDVYARWMVANVAVLKEAIKTTRQRLDKAAGITTKERYWSAVMAAVLTGAMAAKKLGLVTWDLAPLWQFAVGAIGGMRRKGLDISRTTGDILAAYLNEFMGGRIVVTKSPSNTWTVLVDLKGNQLVYRVEQDVGRIYIDRMHFRNWFTRNGGDYNSLMADLRGAGLLLRVDTKRSLGQGTNYTTAVTTCIELDLTHPLLSAQPVLKVVTPDTAGRQNEGNRAGDV